MHNFAKIKTTSKKKMTSKIKKTLKPPNPPKAQAYMKTSLHEENLHYAGLHTALDIFRFAVFFGIVIGGCASGIYKCLNEFEDYTNLYLDLSCQE